MVLDYYSTTRHNGMVKGQLESVPILMTVPHIPDIMQKLSHADAQEGASSGKVVAKRKTCTAQNRASAETVMCINNEH